MTSIKIHLLIHPKYLGDKNQALGIKTSLMKQLSSDPEEKMEIKEWDESQDDCFERLTKEFSTDYCSQHIMITIGDHGLRTLQQIRRQPAARYKSCIYIC